MNGNIIVAYDIGHGRQDQTLEAFISGLIKDDTYHHDTAFLESEHQDLETVMTTLIQGGVDHFKIVPLLIFSTMHYLKDIPNIIHETRRRYPDIKVETGELFGTHPLMKRLIEQCICDALAGDKQQVGVMVVAHDNINGKLTKAYEELQIYAQNLQTSKPTYARTLYREISFIHDLGSVSRRCQKSIAVPLFLYDGRPVNKMERQMNGMIINTDIRFIPSVNSDPILKQITNDRLGNLTIPAKI